jgi:SAM-dependent methyltransferase
MHDHDVDDAREWDERYRSERDGAPMWSGEPNGSLVVEVADLAPGTALDVGCGEGADAIWLAQRGWQVTALDPSRVALDRAAAAARRVGVAVTWVPAGFLEAVGDLGAFDLVSAHYAVLRHDPDDTAIVALLDAVATGGTLLVVHHDLDPDHATDHAAEHGTGHGFDPTEYVLPADVAAHLDDGWLIEVDEVRPRPGVLLEEARHVRDIVLRARRRGPTLASSTDR